MEISGQRSIAQGQDIVWAALNDPTILQACVPGCDSIEALSPDEYRLGMTVAVGPVKAKFAGKLKLSDVVAPNSYTITFEGSGGIAGFGKGSAKVTLAPEAEGTKLNYMASAQVGGKIAQVGSRLIDSVARKMADEFFQRFSARVALGESPNQLLESQ